MTTHDDYQQQLILALRLKDVPGDRIGEIVAEVESHVAESGEDPVEAFGSPRQYAASLVDEHRPDPWWSSTLTIVCSAAAGWLIVQGGVAAVLGQSYWGQPGWVWIVLSLAIAIPGGLRIWRRSTRVTDPRTGRDLVPFSLGGIIAFVSLPLLTVTAAIVSVRIFD